MAIALVVVFGIFQIPCSGSLPLFILLSLLQGECAKCKLLYSTISKQYWILMDGLLFDELHLQASWEWVMGFSSPLCAQQLLMPWNWRSGSIYVTMITIHATTLWLNCGYHSPKSNISSLTAVLSSQRSCSAGLFGHLRECPILGSGQLSFQ